MPRVLSSTDLRPRLAEALRSAEGGEHVVITRHGKPVAALIAADQLDRLVGLPAGGPPERREKRAETDAKALATVAGGPTPEELLERAAAPSLRRIDLDLERLPEALRPVLGMIRKNLFQPRLTVGRIRRVLGVGANDLTTRFHAAAGAPIRKYREDRRLECACRLLVDTEIDVEGIAMLLGYRRSEGLSRAFKRRYGVRPPVYREFGGRLSREAAAVAGAGQAPIAPRCLAGVASAAPGSLCGRCGDVLEPEAMIRVFEDLAPICDRCARERAPELAGLRLADGTG